VPEQPRSTPPDRGCPKLDADAAERAFVEGRRMLEESRDGEYFVAEPFGRAMARLLKAAEGGQLEAQYLYGITLFGAMFTNQAPQANERDDYVRALKLLRVAAKRGHAGARDAIPGLAELRPGDDPPAEPPLDQIPKKWLQEAVEGADAWIACYGDAASWD
jgi:TPR repeat protein